ncbi:alpha/beta-hydrolase [Xylariaceae sp. FL1651]|nr:alpha/beta-hydrolase [Xylariaceae sp. FL1651]
MAAPKPVIVIIHGAFLGPPCYAKLTTTLKAAGFEVHVPELPTLNGDRPPTTSLSGDTEFIRSYVEKLLDAGHTVVAIMHSYGGQVGSNALAGMGTESRAARGLKGAVSHLLYMCAFALPEETSMIDKVTEMGHIDLIPIAYDIAEDGMTVERSPRERLLGPWDYEEEAEAYVTSFRIWNGNAMYQKVQRCAWREIPVTYVYTSQDACVPLFYQESMVEGLRSEGVHVKTETLETGHSPHFTMPEEVADIVKRVVDGLA